MNSPLFFYPYSTAELGNQEVQNIIKRCQYTARTAALKTRTSMAWSMNALTVTTAGQATLILKMTNSKVAKSATIIVIP